MKTDEKESALQIWAANTQRIANKITLKEISLDQASVLVKTLGCMPKKVETEDKETCTAFQILMNYFLNTNKAKNKESGEYEKTFFTFGVMCYKKDYIAETPYSEIAIAVIEGLLDSLGFFAEDIAVIKGIKHAESQKEVMYNILFQMGILLSEEVMEKILSAEKMRNLKGCHESE